MKLREKFQKKIGKALDESNENILKDFYITNWNRSMDLARIKHYADLNSILLSEKFPILPDKGKIVELGSRNGETLDILCQIYGDSRCIGVDMFNEKNHPNILKMNVTDLEDFSVAFVFNDIGGWSKTPKARKWSYEWSKRNCVDNGLILEQSDNRARWELSKDMKSSGFSLVFPHEWFNLYQKKQVDFKFDS